MIDIAKARVNHWDRFFNSLIAALIELFALRLADRELSLLLSWIDPTSCMHLQDDAILFEKKIYRDRVLMKNGKMKLAARLEELTSKWRDKLDGDPRMCIRGHDFTKLLALAIKEFRGMKGFTQEEVVLRLFVLMAGNARELELLFQ